MVKKIFKTTALLIVVFMLSACTIWIGGTRIKINEKTGEYKDKETDKEHDFAVSTEDDETPVDFSGNEIPEDDDGSSSSDSGSSSSGESSSSGSSPIESGDIGQKIVDYAIETVKRSGEFRYISPSDAGADKMRINTYNGEKTDGYLKTDCNGFVGYVLHNAVGIGPSKAKKASDIKVAKPSKNSWVSNNSRVKVIETGLTLSQALSKAQPGDLLASKGESTHIQIFIGDGVVIDNGAKKTDTKPIMKRCVTKNSKKGCERKILHQNDSFTILRAK